MERIEVACSGFIACQKNKNSQIEVCEFFLDKNKALIWLIRNNRYARMGSYFFGYLGTAMPQAFP